MAHEGRKLDREPYRDKPWFGFLAERKRKDFLFTPAMIEIYSKVFIYTRKRERVRIDYNKRLKKLSGRLRACFRIHFRLMLEHTAIMEYTFMRVCVFVRTCGRTKATKEKI